MKKTSVYLTEDEVEGLRRLAAATGRKQAELIRDGVRLVLESANGTERTFHSLGAGHGGGVPYAGWSADELFDSVMGSK